MILSQLADLNYQGIAAVQPGKFLPLALLQKGFHC